MGRNESTVELLVKVWEGIREFLEVPNESTGFFFRHMRVQINLGGSCVDLRHLLVAAMGKVWYLVHYCMYFWMEGVEVVRQNCNQ